MAQMGQGAPDLRPASQRKYKVRTGAKTATKAQQKAYLERFSKLAKDPSLLLPEWKGSGTSPFGRVASRLAKIKTKRDSGKSVDRWTRKKGLEGAYAAMLKVLDKGEITSFAQLPQPGRTIKFVPRGKAGNNHQVAVQNHDEPDLLMLGYLEYARKKKAAFWVVKDRLVATDAGAAMPDGFAQALFAPASVPVADGEDGRVACTHAADGAWHARASIEGVRETLALCEACLGRIDDRIETWLARRHLGAKRKPSVTLHVAGQAFQPGNDETADSLKDLVESADEAARAHAHGYEEYSNREFLDWGRQMLREALARREQGHLLVGSRLWLAGYAEALDELLPDERERRLVKAAFAIAPPHLETSEASIGKLLGPAWGPRGVEILRHAVGQELPEARLKELAAMEPSDAARALDRAAEAHERLRRFPSYDVAATAAPMALALRVGEAWHGSGAGAAVELVNDGARRPELKVAALAFARAMDAAGGMEWRFTAHEKQEADFLTPYARQLLQAEPDAYPEAVGAVAKALGTTIPPRKDT